MSELHLIYLVSFHGRLGCFLIIFWLSKYLKVDMLGPIMCTPSTLQIVSNLLLKVVCLFIATPTVKEFLIPPVL